MILDELKQVLSPVPIFWSSKRSNKVKVLGTLCRQLRHKFDTTRKESVNAQYL